MRIGEDVPADGRGAVLWVCVRPLAAVAVALVGVTPRERVLPLLPAFY